jgi:methionyl-tRNA formyltransferase
VLLHHDVVAVVTQPDRPAHRGRRLTAPPVKERALAAGLPVFQPGRLREPGWAERLSGLGADVGVVVAFGQILPGAVLAAPARGSINVHASLLPRYRGAAPIAWAIIRGETETGVTTFQMDEGMDTGPLLLSAATRIGAEETAGELAVRLARMGAGLLLETLERLDVLVPRPQAHHLATLAPRLRKEDGVIPWTHPARELAALVRGVNPWPGAVTRGPRGLLTIWRARAVIDAPAAPPGTLVPDGSTLLIATGEGALLPLHVQAESRRLAAWPDYLRGARLEAGMLMS